MTRANRSGSPRLEVALEDGAKLILQGAPPPSADRARRRSPASILRAGRKEHRIVDDVLQLADVAGPGMGMPARLVRRVGQCQLGALQLGRGEG